MSILSLEEFKEYLLSEPLPEEDVHLEFAEEIETTIPNANTNYIEWAYENQKWIPAIGIRNLKSYFLSLIYTPYDGEMVDITSAILEPEKDSDVISLKTDPVDSSSSSSTSSSNDEEEEFKESEIMQLLSLLMQSAGAMKFPKPEEESGDDADVSADMEVD